MSAIGQLTISQGPAKYATWRLVEGGSLVHDVNGETFKFDLATVPIDPIEALDRLSTVQIVEYLAQRIRDEDSAREQDAIESRWED